MTTNNQHPGFVLWMTGLSGAGKTTIALILVDELKKRGVKVERLDGDVVRESLTRDLGFTKEDRDKNIERVTFVAKLLSRNGVGCICSFISPYQAVRDRVRANTTTLRVLLDLLDRVRANTTNFLEVYVDAPLDVVIERDVKGLYQKAMNGEIPNFTGISDPFEAPQNPDIHVRTDQQTPEESAQYLLSVLEEKGLI